ncbi:putative low-complexity protein [Rivularia sp. PCC 7116]|uniref:pentapeptide repeat-containing protein n=1 Tax=Rivularia sp. PCC 7116 TaxID=373994 RepID=UPI00029F38BC|nr:pentapeptide repeat-containing protein [Rivularia sp. PCC 7116]AFY53660.1 putative low-complexity protein [Rivularia sp. PCC 7116]
MMAQEYRRAKLRGKSFKGQDLTGVDFSNSDIRGTDFTNAILRDANFSHTKSGLQRRWAIILIFLSLLLCAVSGLMSAIGGSLVGFILVDSARSNVYVGASCLIILLIYFLLSIGKGVLSACVFLAVTIALAIVAAVSWAGFVAVFWSGLATTSEATQIAPIVAVVTMGTVAVIVTAVGAVCVTISAAITGAIAGVFAVMIAVMIAGVVAGAVSVYAMMVNPVAGVVAGIVSLVLVILSAFIGITAISEDKKQNFVRKIAISLTTRYGTSFRNADLTDADFTQAKLKSANFTKAKIKRTNWFEIKEVHLAAVNTTYLENAQMRELVVNKNLQNKIFDGWNLRGINLQGANLKDASFVGANLNQTNLRNADLSRAKLVRSQLDKADLRNANLTGAYIEDWSITPQTLLHPINCDYIFLRVPTPEDPNPHRLPANWEATFKDDEFNQSMNPLLKVSNFS